MNIIQIEIKDSTMPTWTWALNITAHRPGILVTVRVFYLEFPESTRGGTAGSVLGANQPTSQWCRGGAGLLVTSSKQEQVLRESYEGTQSSHPGVVLWQAWSLVCYGGNLAKCLLNFFLHWFGAEAVMMVIARSGKFCLASAGDPAGLFSKDAAWGLPD